MPHAGRLSTCCFRWGAHTADRPGQSTPHRPAPTSCVSSPTRRRGCSASARLPTGRQVDSESGEIFACWSASSTGLDVSTRYDDCVAVAPLGQHQMVCPKESRPGCTPSPTRKGGVPSRDARASIRGGDSPPRGASPSGDGHNPSSAASRQAAPTFERRELLFAASSQQCCSPTPRAKLLQGPDHASSAPATLPRQGCRSKWEGRQVGMQASPRPAMGIRFANFSAELQDRLLCCAWRILLPRQWV